MKEAIEPAQIPVGVVGLGLMGCSITTCLLMAGHPVVAVAPIADDLKHAETRIKNHLEHSQKQGLITHEPSMFMNRLVITMDYQQLKPCKLVIECTIENQEIKQSVYEKIE